MSETAGPVDPTPTPPRRRMLAGLVGLLLLAAVVVVVVLLADDKDDSPGTGEDEPAATPSTPTDRPPTDGPQPPDGPGTLISKSAFTTSVPDTMQAWRIAYTTTDRRGQPATATATILTSKGDHDGPRPVVGVGHGSVGTASRCAPSLSDQPFTTSVTALATLVQEGWVAVTSDYAGLGSPGPHPFLVGKAEAHNVLDAVRAAHHVLELSPKTLLMGDSQGGHAVLWAGAEAPSYAPELEVIGVAATAPATDLHALITQTSSTVAGTLVAMSILNSWQQVYPEAGLAGQLQQSAEYALDQVSRLCGQSTAEAGQMGALAQSVVGGLVVAGAYDGEFGRLLRENTPTGRIEAPVLVAQGTADPLVLPAVQREWVAERCSEGQAIDYREYAGHNHASVVQPTSPLMGELVQWARDRLTGKPARGNCR